MSIVTPGRTASAAAERDRIVKVLVAIEEVREASALVRRDGMSEAAETLAMDELVKAEERLQELTLDPAFADFLGVMVISLASIAGAAA